MKKLLVVICSIVCICCFAACGNDDQNSSKNSAENSQNSVSESATESVLESQTTSDNSASASVSTVTAISAEYSVVRKTTFVQGEALTAIANCVVTYSNGTTKRYFMGEPYTVESDYNKDVVGEYNVKLSIPGTVPFEYKVNVIYRPAVVNGIAKIKIVDGFTGVKGLPDAQGYAQYATIKDSFEIIRQANYAATDKIEIYLGEKKYVEKLAITSSMKNITLIGVSEDKTIISYGDCSSMAADSTDASASFTIMGEGFKAKNITFENSYDYINGTEANKQATAVLADADKCVFENCTFLGYQDTLQAKSGRQYYKNCTIKGTTDFIFGNNATALFSNCDIVTRFTKADLDNNGYVTAQKGNKGTNGQQVPTYGYVFDGCRLTCETGVKDSSVSLGRPWRADATVAYLNCEMGAHISKVAFGGTGKTRYDSMSGGNLINEPQNAHFAEFGNTGAGAITEAVLGCTILSQAQADLYTPANIFALTNGGVTYVGEFNPIA